MYKLKINEAQKKLYEKLGYWTEATLLDKWKEAVADFGDREFVVSDRGVRLSYSQIDRDADALACHMEKLGIGKADVVSFQITPRAEFVVCLFACIKLGAVPAPLGMCFIHEELKDLLQMLKSRLHISCFSYRDSERAEMLEKLKESLPVLKNTIYICDNPSEKAALPEKEADFHEIIALGGKPKKTSEAKSDDLALILCTSGTTQGCKAVMFTHNNIIYSEEVFNRTFKITGFDSIFMPAPLSHATGLHHGIISPMLCGAKLVLQERFDCVKAVSIMNEEKCSYSMGATPFIYDILQHLEESGNSLEHLRFYICGGAPVPRELVLKSWERYKILLCECYGSTESVPHVCVRPEECLENAGKWAGRAMGEIEVRVVDKNHNTLPPGKVGEAASRGPNVFVGYLGAEKLTDEALDDEGWYYSGDLCVSDEKGNIKIVGREKDIIVRGGENLNANDINEHIEGCPGLIDHSVIGMPDPRLGERICLFAVTEKGRENITNADIIEYLKSKGVHKRHWPERLEVIDEIPRTESGKVRKNLLSEELKRRMSEEKSERDKREEASPKPEEKQAKAAFRRIGPCRYLASAKPLMQRPPVSFFRCGKCGTVFTGDIPEGGSCNIFCCGEPLEKLLAQQAEDMPPENSLSYDIVGGLNENCIRVFWKGQAPSWIYLQTFTGGQKMFIKKTQRPPAVFALAGEDAYAYCDKDPCIKCSFRCKSGFVIYGMYENKSFFMLPVNQIAATPGSGASMTKKP